MAGSYNAEGVSMAGQPFPPAFYHLKVTAVEPGTTKKGGDPKVTIEAMVVGPTPHAGRLIKYHTVTFLPPKSPGAGMALAFLKAIGEPYEGQFEWDETRWIAKVFKAKVVIEKANDGNEYNRIAFVSPPDKIVADSIQNSGEEPCPY